MGLAVASLAFSVSAGGIIAWGDNSSGQITVPPAAADAVAVAAGYRHSLALKPDGTAVAWGTSSDGLNTVPAPATNLIAIAAGGTTSSPCARTAS